MSLNKLSADLNTDGNEAEQPVSDNDVQGLLLAILKELKTINVHLSIMTDHEIQKGDLE